MWNGFYHVLILVPCLGGSLKWLNHALGKGDDKYVKWAFDIEGRRNVLGQSGPTWSSKSNDIERSWCDNQGWE